MTEQLQAGGRIVVGTDLSHNADHAVDWAAARDAVVVAEQYEPVAYMFTVVAWPGAFACPST